MFISRKRLRVLEDRVAELEKAQRAPVKIDIQKLEQAFSEQLKRTGHSIV